MTIYAAIKYLSPFTCDVFLLKVHQAIKIPNMDHQLIFPMEFYLNGVSINDTPNLLIPNPTEKFHSISIPNIAILPTPGNSLVVAWFFQLLYHQKSDVARV